MASDTNPTEARAGEAPSAPQAPGASRGNDEAPAAPRCELFHLIADPGSAAARRAVVELDLGRRVRFRNLAYPEVAADLAARGGTRTPALWDGSRLVEGEAAVLEGLAALGAAPAAGPSSPSDPPNPSDPSDPSGA